MYDVNTYIKTYVINMYIKHVINWWTSLCYNNIDRSRRIDTLSFPGASNSESGNESGSCVNVIFTVIGVSPWL